MSNGKRGNFSLTAPTNSKHFCGVVPFFKATVEACCMVGPSAIGSEKGIPISTISAPDSTIVLTISSVYFNVG
jgi:hypothetical protein